MQLINENIHSRGRLKWVPTWIPCLVLTTVLVIF